MILNNETAKKLKRDFPIFQNQKDLIYLDNGATTQKPKSVIDKISDFYENSNANVFRGIYKNAETATEAYSKARELIARFINADAEEIIFTNNSTDSINSLSYAIDALIPEEKNEIVLTEMEHHSNLIPWQQLAMRKNMKLKFIKLKSDFTLDLDDALEKITEKTAIVSVTHISNALGTINPVSQIAEIAKKNNAIFVVDASQSVPHIKVDVKEIDCDFLAFSGHKMLAPTGIGVLYGKKDLLEKISPFRFGGGMIKSVTPNNAEFADLPQKFEAGTPNIAGAIALGESVTYLNKIGMKNIESWEQKLVKYLIEKLKKIQGIEIYNPGIGKTSGILSFNISGIHPHDTASLMDDYRISVRAGHHCCMPLMKSLGLQGTVRVSFYFYNTFEDIDKIIEAIKNIKEKFGK